MRLLQLIKRKFLGNQLDLRVRLFNILAIAGTLISLTIALSGVLNGNSPLNILVSFGSAVLSAGLLYYSYQSGNYQACYLITIVIIFMMMFPILFFTAGGYHSGMPAFFVFAVLFTIFMLDGRRAFFISTAELVLYVGCCVYAYLHPEAVILFATEQDVLVDVIIGFSAVSISLGITMFLHFRLYNEKQRELEAARREAVRLSEVKSTFLANMSHEIRTPINVMLGMNEMVLRESESDTVVSYAKNAQNAGRSLLALVNNVLDVSKIESGKMEVLEENYRVEELIRELCVIGGERAEKRGLHFSLAVDEMLPSELTGDFIHIRQVAVNFLSNAVKYTEKGTVALSFFQRPAETAGNIVLCVSVKDTGIGIRDEDKATLFEAFTRVDLPTHRGIEGTGLGLAIAKELTELMGGAIHMKSVWGRGSTFTVEIPQTVRNAVPLGKRAFDGVHETQQGLEGSFLAPSGRVLVVDDREENLRVIRLLLAHTLLKIDTAPSGPACLEMVKKNAYHVVFLDYMMPDMDGIETFRRIREANPAFQTPVVALTANAVVGSERMFLEQGFAAYLPKPILWQDLERTLVTLLPPGIVSKTEAVKMPALPDDAKHTLEEGLARCAVSLGAGLKYSGGNIAQYAKLAKLFTEDYEHSLSELNLLERANDYQTMLYGLHSLKSKAKSVGASALHDVAARLEKRCMAGDVEYIKSGFPLLRLEWKRATHGLCEFLSRAEGLLPRAEAEMTAQKAPPEAVRALAYIRAYRRSDAENELDGLLEMTADVTVHNLLADVRDAVNALDFAEAEELMKTLA